MVRNVPSLGRRPARVEPKKRFSIFCEGRNTEPGYFLALSKAYANALVSLKIVAPAGVPYSVAEKARDAAEALKSARDSFEGRDEVWAVFDRDEHPRCAEAIELCKRSGVGVGFSNPCFELWLVLHFEDFAKLDSRHSVQSRLRKLDPAYNPKKDKQPDFASLIDGVEGAEKRAKKLCENREKEGQPFGLPSTTVGDLTQAIRNSSVTIT